MKVKFTLGIGFHNANHTEIFDIDDSEIEGMTKKEIDEYLDQCWQDWAWNYIDGGPHILEENKGTN